MILYTDYPFREFGDKPYSSTTPIRTIIPLSYDGNKYCTVMHGTTKIELKIGYVYVKDGYILNDKSPFRPVTEEEFLREARAINL